MTFPNSFESNPTIENFDRSGFSIFVVFSVCCSFCLIAFVFFKMHAFVSSNEDSSVVASATVVVSDATPYAVLDVISDVVPDDVSDDIHDDVHDEVFDEIAESFEPIAPAAPLEPIVISPEELHRAALQYFLERSTVFNGYQEQITAEMYELIEQNFKKCDLEKTIRIWLRLCSTWRIFEAIRPRTTNVAILARKHKQAREWNIHLNSLRGIMRPESVLRNLMLLDSFHGCLKPFVVKPKDYKDISTLERREASSIVLHLTEGRIIADTAEDMINRLCFYLDETTTGLLITRRTHGNKCTHWDLMDNRYQVSIDIPVRFTAADGRATNRTATINSNAPAVLQLLFPKNAFPQWKFINDLLLRPNLGDRRFRYERFYAYVRVIRRTIARLLDVPQQQEYVFIRCIRITPHCEHEQICQRQSKTYAQRCAECGFQMCSHGCGKAFHGNTRCEDEIDAQSEAAIRAIAVRCPGCSQNVQKESGCNHMTCKCLTEFCWICGVEYEHDVFMGVKSYDHRIVSAHHARVNAEGHLICSRWEE